MKEMRERVALAALATTLVLAAPAEAQQPVDSRPLAAQRLGPPDQGPAYLAPGAGLFPSQGAGLSVTTQNYSEQDGEPAIRKGLVGSVEVAPNATIGIGLFSVNRYSRREPEFRRIQPMRDVRGQEKKIAAVGLSFSF